MTLHYIGADVDCKTTVLAVRRNGKVVAGYRVPTTIPALAEVLERIPDPKVMTAEEGPLADWLWRNLRHRVQEFLVCDPRRNRLIVGDGDKDNRIDAEKLAELYECRSLRPVHHPDSQERADLKEWVSLYHDRVAEAVRQVNKLRARCRMHGRRPPAGFLRQEAARKKWLTALERAQEGSLAGQLRVLLDSFDRARELVVRCRREMARRSRPYPIVEQWQAVPGVGPVRAITLLAYLDTPWRFGSPQKRWKYCGIGLTRATTGTNEQGRDKPGWLHVCLACNHRLKAAVMGATVSALAQGGNKFHEVYMRLLAKGVHAGNARRAAARKLLDTLTGMWKNGSDYHPEMP